MDDEQIKKLREEGKSLRQIGSLLELSYETIRKRLKRLYGNSLSTAPGVNVDKLTVSTSDRFGPKILREIKENRESRLRVDLLVSQSDLKEKLKLGGGIFLELRKRGCPYLDFGGRIFYHQEIFVRWVLENLSKIDEVKKNEA